MQEEYKYLYGFSLGKRFYVLLKNKDKIKYFERIHGNYELPIISFNLYDNEGKSLTHVNQHFFMNELVNRINDAYKKGFFVSEDDCINYLNDLDNSIKNDVTLRNLFKGFNMKQIDNDNFEKNKREIINYLDKFKIDSFVDYNNISVFEGSISKTENVIKQDINSISNSDVKSPSFITNDNEVYNVFSDSFDKGNTELSSNRSIEENHNNINIFSNEVLTNNFNDNNSKLLNNNGINISSNNVNSVEEPVSQLENNNNYNSFDNNVTSVEEPVSQLENNNNYNPFDNNVTSVEEPVNQLENNNNYNPFDNNVNNVEEPVSQLENSINNYNPFDNNVTSVEEPISQLENSINNYNPFDNNVNNVEEPVSQLENSINNYNPFDNNVTSVEEPVSQLENGINNYNPFDNNVTSVEEPISQLENSINNYNPFDNNVNNVEEPVSQLENNNISDNSSYIDQVRSRISNNSHDVNNRNNQIDFGSKNSIVDSVISDNSHDLPDLDRVNLDEEKNQNVVGKKKSGKLSSFIFIMLILILVGVTVYYIFFLM